MTAQELERCLDALPPDVKRELLQQRAVVRDYLGRASQVRERLERQFPNMNPRLRAVISLAVARIL